MQALILITNIGILCFKLVNKAWIMVTESTKESKPDEQPRRTSFLVCSRCNQATYRVCTSLAAYQFYVFIRRRYREYICVTCCNDLPAHIIDKLFKDKVIGKGAKTLETLQDEHRMISKMYEKWYLGKRITNRSNFNEVVTERLRTSRLELEKLCIMLTSLVDESISHEDESYTVSMSTESETTESDDTNLITLKERNKYLEIEIANLSKTLDATKGELARKGTDNYLYIQRIRNLESHQSILREHINDQKKMLALAESKHVKGSVTRSIPSDLSLMSNMQEPDGSMALYICPTKRPARGDDDDLTYESTDIDACTSDINTQVTRASREEISEITPVVYMTSDTECDEICTDDDTLDVDSIEIDQKTANNDVTQYVSSENCKDLDDGSDNVRPINDQPLHNCRENDKGSMHGSAVMCLFNDEGTGTAEDVIRMLMHDNCLEEYELDQSIADDDLSSSRSLRCTEN